MTKSQLRERLARLGERPVSDPSAVEETEAHLDQLAQREGEELLAEAQGWQPGQPLPPKTQALVDEMKRQLLRGLPAEAAAPSPPLRITKRKLPNDDDRAAAERWKAAYPLRGNYLLEDLLTFMAGDLLADGGHVLRLLVHDGYHFNPSGQIVS